MSDNFWEDIGLNFAAASPLDEYLQGRHEENPSDVPIHGRGVDGDYFSQVQGVTAAGRKKFALQLPSPAGTRVRFVSSMESLFSYDDVPGDRVLGTLITVKSAGGNVTSHEGSAFVMWDDGVFRAIRAEHLRVAKDPGKTASTVRIATTDLNKIASMFGTTSSSDELVHKATQDLWSFRKDGDQYVLERLYNDTGKPLKV